MSKSNRRQVAIPPTPSQVEKPRTAIRVVNQKTHSGELVDKTIMQKHEFKKFNAQEKFEVENTKGWVDWGQDNLRPQYLGYLYKSSGLHRSIIDGFAQIAAGLGTGIEKLDACLVPAFRQFALYGIAPLEILYTRDGQDIAEINVLSMSNIRFSWDKDSFKVNGAWYSRDWTQPTSKRGKAVSLQMFDRIGRFGKDSEGNTILVQPKQVAFIMLPSEDGRYYPDPTYQGGIDWIEVDRQAAEFHRNSLENGLFPSMMITVKGTGTTEQEDAIINSLENQLSGASNTGRFVVNFTDVDGGFEFTPITTNEADKLYQWQVDTAAEKILQAHGVVSPLLFGIRTATGFGGNAEEMKTGEYIYNERVIKPAQALFERELSKIFLQDVKITPKPSMFAQETADTSTGGADVASLALNGAQIESLVNIILQVATGSLPVESGKAVVAAGFPMLSQLQIDGIFTGIVPGSTTKEQVLSKVYQSLEKKKFSSDLLSEFIEINGEVASEDWICIDEYEADVENDDADFFVSTGTARPNAKSSLDRTIDGVTFYARFEYAGSTNPERPFCQKMMSAGKIYRKEDIMAMGTIPVNAGWGPRGADTYSIWMYKGGGNCHHYWMKKIFVSAKDLGVDINSPKAKTIAAEKAAAKGFRPRIQRLVQVKPIDMPNQGFLPKD